MAPSLVVLQSVVSYLMLPTYFLVAWVFYRRGLWSSYRYFLMGILLEGFASGLSLATMRVKGAQKLIYLTAQPVLCFLYVLMVIEVFRKVFIRFPGIARFAQRFIVASMLVAFIFALATAGGDVHKGATTVQYYSAATRTITTALCAYLLFIAAFLVWMPVPLPLNSIRHGFLMFFYFIATTAVHYEVNIGNLTMIKMVNLLLYVITLIALLSWAWLLQPSGELAPSGQGLPRTGVSTLLNRLESINKTLSPPEE